jgi:mercuric ion transport protein
MHKRDGLLRSAKNIILENKKFFIAGNFNIQLTGFISILFVHAVHKAQTKRDKRQPAKSIEVGSIQDRRNGVCRCAVCTKHIDGNISRVAGVVKVNTSFEKANTSTGFDSQKVSVESLKNKIGKLGYLVTGTQMK